MTLPVPASLPSRGRAGVRVIRGEHWYATAGHDLADVADHRARAPGYTTKAAPSTADMAAKLRRVLIAAGFKASRPDLPTPEEISILRLAWENLAA